MMQEINCAYTLNLLTTPSHRTRKRDLYAGGAKGHDGSDEKLYCQVAIEKRETLFVNDPSKVPGLETGSSLDMAIYYVGAPRTVGPTTGEGFVAAFVNTHTVSHTHIIMFEHASTHTTHEYTIDLETHMCTSTHTQVQWLLWRRSLVFLNQNTRPSLKSSETI